MTQPFRTRIRAVRFKNGGEVRRLVTERELDAIDVVGRFADSAMDIGQQHQDDMAGFVIVAWSDDGAVTVQQVIGRQSPVLKALVPVFVAESLRTDMAVRHAVEAIEEDEDVGSAS